MTRFLGGFRSPSHIRKSEISTRYAGAIREAQRTRGISVTGDSRKSTRTAPPRSRGRAVSSSAYSMRPDSTNMKGKTMARDETNSITKAHEKGLIALVNVSVSVRTHDGEFMQGGPINYAHGREFRGLDYAGVGALIKDLGDAVSDLEHDHLD